MNPWGLEEALCVPEQQVAFSAALMWTGNGSQGPYNVPVTLIFKHGATNIEKAYNGITGMALRCNMT